MASHETSVAMRLPYNPATDAGISGQVRRRRFEFIAGLGGRIGQQRHCQRLAGAGLQREGGGQGGQAVAQGRRCV